MPTEPFSDELVTKLKSATAWRFDSRIGEIFTPRFFCCDDPNTLGISDGKEPVAVIELDPNPAFTSETVNYAGTLSYDPDGSITNYAWTFESHTPSSGTASSGTLNYASAGTYTIELVVTDGTGLKSSPAREELVVLDVIDMKAYIATSSGVFYTSDGGSTLTDKNSGLSGDELVAYDVAIDPATQHLPQANQTVWRSNLGSIHVSTDGGATWNEQSPSTVTNTWSDGTAPTVADLSFKKLHFRSNILFTLANWQNGSGEERSWIMYTADVNTIRDDPTGTATWSEV